MFRVVCTAEDCLQLSPLPEDLGRMCDAKGAKSLVAGEQDHMFCDRQKGPE